jgi:hypothetical protein
LGSDVTAILEPSVEEYAFVTPRDAGSPFFAVSIKYRVNVYTADGKLADSWGFTGYGTSPAGGLSNTEPLENATALAMRDAGAKLIVEFRDQPVVRGLFPGAETADDPPPASPSTPTAPTTSGDAPEPIPSGQSNPVPSDASGSSGEAPSSEPSSPPEEGETLEEDSDEKPEPSTPEVEAFALSMVRPA